jgi:hypothetical protein
MENQNVFVVTTFEMLHRGLLLMGFDEQRIARVNEAKNVSRFGASYVGHPRVYADLFERLQRTEITEARLDCDMLGREKTLDYFLMAIYLLASYPTEEQAEGVFKVSDRTFRFHAWNIVHKISLLFSEIITWPKYWGNPDSENEEETIFIITVDGTHCRINEPTLDSFDEQRKYYSHKFKTAGLDYEVALSIFEQKCVWVAGPYPAGKHDITIFRHKLKDRLLATRAASGVNHRAIGDRGYRGEYDLLSVPSSHDTEEVRDFKGRAMSRQETFNTRLKFFDCLDETFCHGIEKHSHCFYACTVIVQLQMDNGFPLFQV